MPDIQFIAYQLKTAAEGNLARQKYPGLSHPIRDIEARAKIMLDAIEAAAKHPTINSPALKVFVAPEFYFRGGEAGAYDVEHISHINAFFDDHLAADKYKKWIFVLGSALGKMPQQSGRQEIINVALVRKGGVRVTDTDVSAGDSLLVYKEYVSHIDFLGPHFGDFNAFRVDGATKGRANVGGSTKYVAPTSGSRPTDNLLGLEPPNISGQNKQWTPSAKLKKFIQKQFVENKITQEQRDRWLAPVDYTISEQSASGLGGGVLFDMAGRTFVLEVCLDHNKRRAQNTTVRNNNDVHLLTSCGMGAEYGWVKNRGYFFRVDGIAHSANCVTYGRRNGNAWEGPAAAPKTIDMTDNARWKRHPSAATNLFQAGRGTVHVFKHSPLP